VVGVHLDEAERALHAELEQRPVVAGAAAALGLPALAHVHGAAGHDQVVAHAEEHVAAREHLGAALGRGHVELLLTAAELS
jgi:hypothetical protein